MRKIFVLIITLIFFSSAAYAKHLKFVQVTDVHLASEGAISSRNVGNSIEGLKKAVDSINKITDLDFVVFSGDNIDQSNEESLRIFCEIVQKLNKPYYIVLGNHDAYNMGGINKEDYLKIVREYNKYQKDSNPYYYMLPNNDFIVIVMDGAISAMANSHGFYYDEQIEWLDNVLSKNKAREALIMQHFPLIEPCEKKSHRVRDPENYFELLTRHNNIFAIFSGHYHAEGIKQVDGIYHVSTPALLDYPYEYRLVEINFNDSTQKYELNTKLIPSVQP